MALDDLREGLSDSFRTVWGKVQESSLFIQFAERFENLAPPAQKIVLLSASLIGLATISYFPYSYISSADEYLTTFQDNKQLIRELYKVKRHLDGLKIAPRPLEFAEIQSSIKTQISQVRIQPDQVKEMTSFPPPDSKSPISKPSIREIGAELNLSSLNLNQLVDVSRGIAMSNPGIKVIGLEIKASAADPHYFDTAFQFVSFALKEPEAKSSDKGKGKK